MSATKITSLAAEKKRREAEAYKSLVLKTFDDFEHADRREYLQRKGAVENANRQKL